MYQLNLKSVAVHVPEIIRGSQKNSGRMDSGIEPSEKDLHTDYSSISTRLPDILDWSFWWGVANPNLGKRRPWGSGWTVRKSVGEFL